MNTMDDNWKPLGDISRDIVNELNIRLEPHLFVAVQRAAREQRTTPSAIIREAVTAYLGVG